jgi:O-antigen/teichoic acid export membrane protein
MDGEGRLRALRDLWRFWTYTLILAILTSVIFALGLAFPGEQVTNSWGWVVLGLLLILPVALVFDWFERSHRMRTSFRCQVCDRENPVGASICSSCGGPLAMGATSREKT